MGLGVLKNGTLFKNQDSLQTIKNTLALLSKKSVGEQLEEFGCLLTCSSLDLPNLGGLKESLS